MKSLSATVMCVIAAFSLSGVAKAACPAGVTPLNFLAGKTWAFVAYDGYRTGAVGTFTTSIGTSRPTATPVGVLSITSTTAENGRILPASYPGTYSVDPTCNSGLLTFNFGGLGFQYAFIMVKGASEMLFLNQNSAFAGNVSDGSPWVQETLGRAKLLPAAPSCTGASATNPLNALAGTNWVFQTVSGYGSYIGTFGASIGTSRPTATPIGVLNVVESYSGNPGFPLALQGNTIVNQDAVPGTYLINPDCSGGQLIFGTSGMAGMGGGMYSFVFVGPNQMYLVTNSNTVPSPTTPGIPSLPISSFSLLPLHGDAYTK